MNPIRNILFIFLITVTFSCDKNRVFDEYKDLGGSWKKQDVVSFSFNQKDTLKKYNLFINIRNNNDYPFSNLYLIVALQEPSGLVKKDTLQYEMAESNGKLLGQGFSDIKESKLYYKENFKFAKAGNYKISIEHAVRAKSKIEGVTELKGVSNVGFRIESL